MYTVEELVKDKKQAQSKINQILEELLRKYNGFTFALMQSTVELKNGDFISHIELELKTKQ